jgi:hypothetical protein
LNTLDVGTNRLISEGFDIVVVFYYSKLKLYKALIQSVPSYGSEAWATTTDEMNALRIFERKIVRKINEPIKEGERRRRRTDKELKDILLGADTVKLIKCPRLM